MEAHAAFSQGTHRVVDPADPPRELSGWAWGVYVSLGLVAILSLVRFFTALGLHSAVNGGGDITARYNDYSRWVAIDGIVFLVCAGVFITWFFQAYKNLRRLGVQGLRFGNGWAVGAWFVPLLSLARPKQIANDIWRGSERGTDVSAGWKQVPVPNLVHWWWGLFLIQGVAVYIGQQMTQSGYDQLSKLGGLSEGFSQIKSGTTTEVIGQIIALVAVVAAIHVVARVTERLDRIREEEIIVAPPPPPPLQTPAEQRIQCPECAEWIQPQANVCRFCGHRLRPPGQ